MRADAALNRSARALYEVAERKADPARVADELDAVAAALEANPDAARALNGAGMAAAARAEAVKALAARAGLCDVVAQLLHVLAERAELNTLPGLAAAFRARLLERRNIVPAEVTTAVALPPERVDALARRLGEVTGKQVQLETRVDPAIIGGVVTRIGSVVYDGSVTGQLARMRQKLVENV